MAATQNFLDAWTGGRRVVLVRIDLSSPSARTIRLASEAIRTPDNAHWEPILGPVEPIRAQSSLLGSGPFLVGATFDIVGERMAWQTEGENLGHAFADYVWEGAKVTISLWERSIALFVDRLDVFKGTVNRIEASLRRVRVHCIQPRRWNRKVPVRSINTFDYPDAPDGNAQPLPIIYGDHSARALRNPPWTTATYKRDLNEMGIARGVVPGYVVDRGGQAGTVKVLFASHALKAVSGASAGGSYDTNPVWIEASSQGRLGCVKWDTGKFTAISSANEAGFSFTADAMLASIGMLPIDVRAGSTASNPRNALDSNDETNYMAITTGQNARFVMSPSGPGAIIKVDMFAAHMGSAFNVYSTLRWPTRDGASNYDLLCSLAAAPTVTRSTIYRAYGANETPGDGDDVPQNNQWEWAMFADGFASDLSVLNATTPIARIYYLGYIVLYRPAFDYAAPAALAAPGMGKGPGQLDPRLVDTGDARNRAIIERAFTPSKLKAPPIFNVSTPFYGNVLGYADDGSGTFTGTASALIQNASDIARHLLVTYGGLPTSGADPVDGASIDIDPSSFGSFVAARSLMKRADAQPWWLSVHIGNFTDISTVLSSIAAQSASMFYVDRFTGALKWIFWGNTQGADYSRAIYKRDLLALSAELSSDTSLTNAVRVQYWQDYNLGRPLLDTFVNKDGSTVGYVIPDVRDQKQIITSSNNVLRWQHSGTGGTTYNLSVGTATYDGNATTSGPMQLAAAIRSGMRLVLSTVNAGFGFHVVANYNSSLDCRVNGTARFGQVPAGRYATGQDLIEAVVAVLNANGSGATFTGSYSDATNLFTVTCSQSWEILVRTATNLGTLAWFAMGWITDRAAATTQVSEQPAYAERFWIANNGVQTITLKWATIGNSIAKTLGWLETADSNPGWLHYASQPRGDRETLAVTNSALYGEKGEVVIQAPWIREEILAQRLRNVVLDYQSRPRVVVRCKVDHMPDVARGQVVTFAADVDTITGFPRVDINMDGTPAASSGTWVGKKFRVIEVVQNMGPTFDQEIVAVEV